MAQRLKEEVRGNIISAAEMEFAANGYSGATMASIARAAGVSTGNLYRYYANKDALFYSLFTEEFAREFLGLLRRRVGSLVAVDDLQVLSTVASQDGEDLLSFWAEHRLRVVVLLARAKGSNFEEFPRKFVDVLMKPTVALLKQESPSTRLRPVVHRTLRTIFDNTVHAIVAALLNNETESSIREAFAVFWSYQLAGLQGLRTWVRNDQQAT